LVGTCVEIKRGYIQEYLTEQTRNDHSADQESDERHGGKEYETGKWECNNRMSDRHRQIEKFTSGSARP